MPGIGMGPCFEATGKAVACRIGLMISFISVKKSDDLLSEGVVMRYDFVERHRGRWPVRTMCRVPRVSAGGYYDWR